MIKQLTVTIKTSTSTLLYSEMGDIVCNSASAITITLPTPSNGLWYRISNVGAGTVIVNYSSVLTTLNQTEQCLCLANGITDWFYSKGGSSQSITKATVESVLTGEISTHTHAQVHELPIGGTVGQVLSKIDGTNYNVQWVDASGNTYVLTKEGVEGVLTGEITSHTHPVEDELPIGGTTGQILAKVDATNGNVTWVDNTKVKVDGNTVMSGDVTFKAGNNITLTQDNTTKTITISSTGGSGGVGYTTASITIPTTGWIADTGDYAYKNNIAITGILFTDVVIVSIDKDSHDVASATQMCPTVDSYDGGVTFYVNTLPTADISASCTIINQSSTTANVSTYANPIDVPPISPSAWDDEFNDTVVDTKWTWLNQGTATVNESNDFINLYVPPSGANSCRCLMQTAPLSYFTLTAKINRCNIQDSVTGGLALYNSVNGRVMFFGFHDEASIYIKVHKYNSVTSYNIAPYTRSWGLNGAYVKIVYDSTGLKFWVTQDGRVWTSTPQYSETLATYLSGITHIGIMGDSWSNSENNIIVDWFRVTEP